MADKKEYLAALKILASLSTAASVNNKLSDLALETEDVQLKKMLLTLAEIARRSGSKVRLASHDPRTQDGRNVAAVKAYCEKVLASVKPQWQILAERHGWTPPAA